MKNQRKIILINKKFQLKICFILGSLVILSTLIYPFAIYDLFLRFEQFITKDGIDLINQRNDLILYLIIVQAVFSLIMFFIILLISHRIAGPMYKLVNYLRDIRDGKDADKLTFRDGDYFPEVADEINKTISYLKSNNEN